MVYRLSQTLEQQDPSSKARLIIVHPDIKRSASPSSSASRFFPKSREAQQTVARRCVFDRPSYISSSQSCRGGLPGKLAYVNNHVVRACSRHPASSKAYSPFRPTLTYRVAERGDSRSLSGPPSFTVTSHLRCKPHFVLLTWFPAPPSKI